MSNYIYLLCVCALMQHVKTR